MGTQRVTQGRFGRILAVLLLLAGITSMAYPITATLIMNASQRQAVIENEKLAQTNDPARNAADIEAARQYNLQLHSGPILDPFLQRVAPNTKLYREYLSYLDYTDHMIGSVKIPSIDVSLPIYHGTYEEELQKGVGHLFGSSLPVGGEGTHAVLTGHSGLSNATMFDNLPKLKQGDAIYIFVAGEKLKYVVTSEEVVIPTQTDSLLPIEGKDLVTLITCTPYGINTHRLLVHAERAPYDPEVDDAQSNHQPTIFRPWMALSAAVIVLLILVFIWTLVRRKKKERPRHARRGSGQTPHRRSISIVPTHGDEHRRE